MNKALKRLISLALVAVMVLGIVPANGIDGLKGLFSVEASADEKEISVILEVPRLVQETDHSCGGCCQLSSLVSCIAYAKGTYEGINYEFGKDYPHIKSDESKSDKLWWYYYIGNNKAKNSSKTVGPLYSFFDKNGFSCKKAALKFDENQMKKIYMNIVDYQKPVVIYCTKKSPAHASVIIGYNGKPSEYSKKDNYCVMEINGGYLNDNGYKTYKTNNYSVGGSCYISLTKWLKVHPYGNSDDVISYFTGSVDKDECLKKTPTDVYKTGKTKTACQLSSLPHDPQYNASAGVNSQYVKYESKEVKLPKGAEVKLLTKVNNGHNGKTGNDWYYAIYYDKNLKVEIEGYIWSGNLENSFKTLTDPEYNVMYSFNSECYKTLNKQTLTEGTKIAVIADLRTYAKKMESVTFLAYKYNDSTKKYETKSVNVQEKIDGYSYSIKAANKNDTSCINTILSNGDLKAGNYQYTLILNLEQISVPIESGVFTIKGASSANTAKVIELNSSNTVSAETVAKDAKISTSKAKEVVTNIVENSKQSSQKVETPPSQKPSSTPAPTPASSSTTASKVYIKGIYKTSTSANTNIRTGAGTNYAKAGNAIPKGTEITVTEVSSNGWGKTSYGGAAGWVALNTCKYLREIPKINKPGRVTVTYNSAKDIPTGTNVEVKWNAIGDTDSYTVYLKNSSGKVIATQEKITGTKTSFNIANAGTYYFTVRAVNSKYTGDESAASASFTAHAPCKVTFKDWDGRTEIRTVTYGKGAVAPANPSRTGYTFVKWDKSFDKVSSDITVNAVYQINSYTVKFIKEFDGKTSILKNERIEYLKAATPPTETYVPAGYKFVGWSNSDYLKVTGNVTVKAVYQWANPDLPVVVTNQKAMKEEDGYKVTFDLTCTDASRTSGRAIVSLKTAAGKQIVTTESAAFSLPKGTNGKPVEVFVPSTEPASSCEIYIVESFGNPIPCSEVYKCSIKLEGTWSGWTTEVKTGYAAREQRTTYSYRTKSTTTANTKSLSGWTYDYTSSSKGSVVSNLSSKPAAVNTDAQVRSISSTTTDVYSTWYRYVHYTNGGYNTSTKKSTTWACAPTKGNTSDGYGPTSIGPHYYESSKKLTPEKSTTFNVNKYKATCSASVSTPAATCTCKNTWFYNETAFQKKTGTNTTYSYQDTFYTYHFYKWSAWSSYSTTSQTTSSTKEGRSRTEYRYKFDVDVASNPSIENNSGISRLATTKHDGLLKTDIPLPNLKAQAGKTLIMYIYKYNEASDWTGEYIGQTKIDSNGDYKFEFKLREEPTANTGDYVVTIGIEGCKDTITVGTIAAPEPEYKVVFKAADPSKNDSEYTVVSEKTVIEGQPVTAPQNPEYPGYRFLGWDTDLSYVTESNMFVEYGASQEEKIITFTARYEAEVYDVMFIDWDTDKFEHQEYYYGDTIIPPVLVAEDGHEAVWDGLTEGQTVTGDMVITAKRDKKNYDVVFYDFDGNVIDTQTVPYQDEAEEVEIEENENMIFLGWEYTEEYPEETVNGEIVVGEDPVVKFYPVYVFAEDTASPAASVASGTYDNEQTVELTCETEGAVIYYTLDGSDPRINGEDGELAKSVYEYSEPIVLNRSTVLTFYAEAFEHNASEPVVEYYAINAGVEESDWMTYDELPDYVTENPSEYNIQSTAGYRFKDVITTSNLSTIQSCENNGWTLDSKVTDTEGSDWMMSEPVLDDTDFELEIGEPEEEEESRYQYSRYKYVDSATGVTLYSNFAPEGIESELETVQLEGKLSLAGYVSGTTVKYYNYNSETWYNQEIVTVMVKPDYKMYRYFLNTSTYSRWTPWTLDAPAADESRETQTETLWKYSVPETHLVNIDYNGAEFGVGTETFIVEKNDLVPFNTENYTHEGYDFIGFFTDEEYTHFFDITDTPVTADMTLYPKYSAHTFDVIFVDYDGTVLSEETVDYGDWAMEPEVNGKDGYVFIGWDTEDYSFVSEDLIIEAQYVPENEYCTVNLDRNKYNMMAGNSFKLNASITPEDTENPNVIWYSTDEEVAVVDDEGNVTALAEGFAEIVVEAESTGEIDICALTVIANPSDEICLSYTSSLSLDKDFDLLRGVKNNTWTASSIKDEFMNDAEDLVITDINGVELAEDAIVGTGAVIKFMNGDSVKDEITVVVTGDMNGDGKVNNRDAAMITRYLVDKETASFAQMCAIDVNGDGNINVRDASMVSRYLVGKEEI